MRKWKDNCQKSKPQYTSTQWKIAEVIAEQVHVRPISLSRIREDGGPEEEGVEAKQDYVW